MRFQHPLHPDADYGVLRLRQFKIGLTNYLCNEYGVGYSMKGACFELVSY
jgi:hypothetical protein